MALPFISPLAGPYHVGFDSSKRVGPSHLLRAILVDHTVVVDPTIFTDLVNQHHGPWTLHFVTTVFLFFFLNLGGVGRGSGDPPAGQATVVWLQTHLPLKKWSPF